MFYDTDGDPDNGTVRWRITLCGRDQTECDVGADRLYEGPGQTVEFTVKPTLKITGGPVLCVVADLNVSDERGASSGAQYRWPVIQHGAAPEPCFEGASAAADHQGTAP